MSIIKKKSGLLMYQKKSAEYMEKIKTTPYPDWKSLHQDLYGFILSKYILLGDVNINAQAFFIDMGEMFLCLFGIFMSNVKIHMA